MERRTEYIDMAAGMMLAWMILGHTASYASYKGDFLVAGNFLSFFMPWFFYKSGMFYKERTWQENARRGVKKLMLPSNLYIWATMNTSDQSLFPIDSAFKRRWDWVYIPIKSHDEENYKIEIGENKYDWWGFLEKINQVIDDTTSSEDKKLGYFFVKAEDKVVRADKFVSKVLFYLWNDVFKNYGFDNPIFSKGENKKFTFSDFFKKDGTPDTDMVNFFLNKLDETIDKERSFAEMKIAEDTDIKVEA